MLFFVDSHGSPWLNVIKMADRINPCTGSYDFLTWLSKLATAPVSELTRLAMRNDGSDISDAAFSALGSKLGGLKAAHAAVEAEQVAEFGEHMAQVWSEVRAGL